MSCWRKPSLGLTSLLLLTCTVQYSTVQTVHVPAAIDLGRGLGEAHAGVLQQVGQHHAGGPGVVMVNEVRRQHFAAQITVNWPRIDLNWCKNTILSSVLTPNRNFFIVLWIVSWYLGWAGRNTSCGHHHHHSLCSPARPLPARHLSYTI